MIQLTSASLMIALSGNLMPDEDDHQRLQNPAVGGVILFARNYDNAAQLRQLTASIRRMAGRSILIAADQEGGRVQRFADNGFTAIPSMTALAAAKDDDVLTAAGIVLAAELLACGVDLSFAPVLDVAHGHSQIIGTRAFSANGEQAYQMASAVATGMAQAGMACCGKHFPGHGYAVADSHKTLPVDKRSRADLDACDLVPFARWAQAAMPAVMTAHIVYEQCAPQPATFSAYWLRDVLRGELNYTGMIISDDLTMAGANIGSMKTRINAALSSGCDGVLLCTAESATESLGCCEYAGDNNSWLSLAPRADNRICTGDEEYKQARNKMQQFAAT